jgi:hypothetical protein
MSSWAKLGQSFSFRHISLLLAGIATGTALYVAFVNESFIHSVFRRSNSLPPNKRKSRKSRSIQHDESADLIPAEISDVEFADPLSELHVASNSQPVSNDPSPIVPKLYAEESQNLLNLLYSIAEDQAKKGFVYFFYSFSNTKLFLKLSFQH